MNRILILVAAFLALCASCSAPSVSNPEENAAKSRLEAYLKDLDDNGLTGSILVAWRGDILASQGIGRRVFGADGPITRDTVFPVGSLTKQFTATAILKLQEEGKLSVNDPISKYFDNVPGDKKDITLHQLLTHSSGIVGGLGYGLDFSPISKDDFLKATFETPLYFDPGTGYHYSNVGYSLLAMIIEDVSGADYETYLQENLFQKAGMEKTGYVQPPWNEADIAHGCKCGEDWGTHLEKWRADGGEISWHLKGNGGVLSTPSDLYKWYLALKENRIITKASFEQLTAPHVKENEEGSSHYGYGWAIMKSDRGTKIIAHNGSNSVFYADFIQLPEEDAVVIYMTNQMRYDSPSVGWEIEEVLFDENYEPTVPQLNSIVHAPGDMAGPSLSIIDQLAALVVDDDVDDAAIDRFTEDHLAAQERAGRFKRWVKDMRVDFAAHRLKRVLEYGDKSYDILLEAEDGAVTEMPPCFDLQFDKAGKIVAFGW